MAVSQIIRIERDYVESLGEEKVLKIENNIYPIIKLGDAFELKTGGDENITSLPVLIINLGKQAIALLINY